MTTYQSEAKAVKAGTDKVAELCKEGKPNAGIRVLDAGHRCFKVLIVPERGDGLPYYL
jgi:hypothetical protein